MLRDERLELLDDLLRQVQSLARQYRASAGCVGGRDSAALLRRLAGQLEGLGARLEFQVRALGDLPDAGDTEQEWLQELAGPLRGRPVSSGDALVLQERAADEERLAALAAAALDQPVPEALRDLLRGARDEARRTAARLRRQSGRGSS